MRRVKILDAATADLVRGLHEAFHRDVMHYYFTPRAIAELGFHDGEVVSFEGIRLAMHLSTELPEHIGGYLAVNEMREQDWWVLYQNPNAKTHTFEKRGCNENM